MGLNKILNIYVLCIVALFIKYTSKVNGYYLSDSAEILIENGYKYNTSDILHTDVEITDSIKEIDQENHIIDDDEDDDDSLLNKNTMDLITIVWYFSTFLALVAFFIVMACSDNHCGRQKPEEPAEPPPPTPAPSYREFAPPNYDSIMEKNRERIFVIPIFNTKTDIDIEVGVEITNETINQNQSQSILSGPTASPLSLSTSSLPPIIDASLSTTSLETTTTTTTTTFVQSSTTIEIPR